MTSASQCTELLAGERVALVGKLAGMSKRDAQQLVRQQGGMALDRADASATLVVVGEYELPPADEPDELSPQVREAAEQGWPARSSARRSSGNGWGWSTASSICTNCTRRPCWPGCWG